MLEKLELCNFQGHADTVLELDPGVNIIIGENDQGKSAVIRAIELIHKNRPTGNRYIRKGTKECTVTEHVNGNIIIRKRNSKDNCYIVNNAISKAMRTDVPEDVATASGVAEINTQSQFDPVFLLSESSMEVTRKLNKVANLDRLDEIIRNINSIKLENNKEVKANKEQLENLKYKIEKLSYVDGMLSEVNELSKQAESIQENQKLRKYAMEGLDFIEKQYIQLKKLEKLTSLDKLVNECYIIQESLNETKSLVVTLKKAREFMTSATKEAKKHKKLLELKPLVDNVTNLEAQANKMSIYNKELKEALLTITDLTSKKDVAENVCRQCREQWERNARGAECPLCGNIITT